MAFTIAQHDALEAAIAEGALSVMYQDRAGGIRRVQYRSLDDMWALLNRMKKDLGLVPNRRSIRLAQPSQGLHPGGERNFPT